jgi:hypothetical protein
MIKWLLKPHKKYQIQAEGYFLGRYFYFRSKFNTSVIEFSNHKNQYNYHLEKSYVLHVNNDYEAEYLNLNFCKLLIYKGCFLFMLHLIKSKIKKLCRL